MDTWNEHSYFPSCVYDIDKEDFLDEVRPVAYEYLEKTKLEYPYHELYPMYQTENFYHDTRLTRFSEYLVNTAWQILSHQGYDMSNKSTKFSSMWLQSHNKYSSMEKHIHSENSQIIGFYFLDTPEDCGRMVLHDPRPGKVQINMWEKDMSVLSLGSTMVNFAPKPGSLYFINSWLPHSFGRNGSDKPFNFIHFNIYVDDYVEPIVPPPAEVI